MQEERPQTITFGSRTDVTPQFDKSEYPRESDREFCAACNRAIDDSYYLADGALYHPTCLPVHVPPSLPKDTPPSQPIQEERPQTITFGSRTDVTPQFDKAEYPRESDTERCASCNQPIADSYYLADGASYHPTCRPVQARSSSPKDTHTAYARALLFGCGAAVVGLVLYSAFAIMTGWSIGYLSLAVGYIVGKGMMAGSRGIGGRRYQVAAVLLTYSAVSLSAIPIMISMMPKDRPAQHQNLAQGKQPGPDGQSSHVSARAAMAALGYLALFGLASPFLELQDPVHGFIGLIILFVGVRIAWRLTAAKIPEISGPFANQSVTS